MKKVNFLFFCEKCGNPNRIPKAVMIDYIPNPAVAAMYCRKCFHRNMIPDYMRKISGDLSKGVTE